MATGSSKKNMTTVDVKKKKSDIIGYVIYGSIILIIITVFLVQPFFEAKTFNKFRKPGTPEATYWDALVSNLRITNE